MPDRTVQPEIRREVQELSLLFEISQILDRSLDLRDVRRPGAQGAGRPHGHAPRHASRCSTARPGRSPSRRPTACPPASRNAAATSSARASPGKVVADRPARRSSRASPRSRSFSTAPAPRKRLQQEGHLVHLRAHQARQRGHRRALSADRLFAEAGLTPGGRAAALDHRLDDRPGGAAAAGGPGGAPAARSRRTSASRRSSRTASGPPTSSATPGRCRRSTT